MQTYVVRIYSYVGAPCATIQVKHLPTYRQRKNNARTATCWVDARIGRDPHSTFLTRRLSLYNEGVNLETLV